MTDEKMTDERKHNFEIIQYEVLCYLPSVVVSSI